MAQGISSSSLNRPLIYEDLIYLNPPHEVLRWLGKANRTYRNHQSSPSYIRVDFAFPATFRYVVSRRTLSWVNTIVIAEPPLDRRWCSTLPRQRCNFRAPRIQKT